MISSSSKTIEQIFNQYKQKIYYLALKVTRNEEDAKDVLQNTFLKVIKNLKNFRGESLISTWLYRIAVNEAYMKWRIKKRQDRLSHLKLDRDVFKSDFEEKPDSQIVRKELQGFINDQIRALPLKYRIVVLLADFERLSYTSICQILKIRMQTLKSRLHRSRLFLRQATTNYYKERIVSLKKRIKTPPLSKFLCDLSMKFLGDYFQDKLPSQKSHRFKRHINDCAPCKVFISHYKRAIALAKCLQCEDIPPDLQAKIKSFIKAPK